MTNSLADGQPKTARFLTKQRRWSVKERHYVGSMRGQMSREDFEQRAANVIQRVLAQDGPYGVRQKCWDILDDAIYRRRFFASPLAKAWYVFTGRRGETR